jgi:uncharacterized repeat protein (TIGR03803 family)
MQRTRQAVRVGKPSWWKTACAICVLCAATAITLPAQTFTTLFSFDRTDGYGAGALVQATNGDLYGTTEAGGANFEGGTVFKITKAGALTTLYSFCTQSNCPDGQEPDALLQAADGNFYGTTYTGGSHGFGHCLQDHVRWHTDDPAQLRRHGRHLPHRGADPSHRWRPLRYNHVGGDIQLWATNYLTHPTVGIIMWQQCH